MYVSVTAPFLPGFEEKVRISLPKNVSLSGDVKANLPLALYGIFLIAVMLAAPGGIQGAVRASTAWGRRRLNGAQSAAQGKRAPSEE